jgi:hypothetical protein
MDELIVLEEKLLREEGMGSWLHVLEKQIDEN